MRFRKQYSVSRLLLSVGLICVFLAKTRSDVLAGYVLLIISVSVALCIADIFACNDTGLPRPVASTLLCGWSIVSLLFFFCLRLFSPIGGSGPRQYIGEDRLGGLIFEARHCTVDLMFVMPVLCLILGIPRFVILRPTRIGWTIGSVIVYICVCLVLMANPSFLPDL